MLLATSFEKARGEDLGRELPSARYDSTGHEESDVGRAGGGDAGGGEGDN